MLRPVRLCIGLLFLAACGSRPPTPEAPEDTSARGDDTQPTCTAPGIEGSHALDALRLPAGCRYVGGGPPSAPQVVRTPVELAAAIACEPGITPPPIDLEASELYVVSYTLSPAFGGSELRDDDATVTFVTRFRPPCPDDPRPMPMSSALGFTLPRGATRTFREASCTLPERCP